MSEYIYPHIIPQLTDDVNLKRARVEDTNSIRVTTTNGDVDLTDITDTLGDVSDPATEPTVIGLLKSIASKLQ